MQSCLSIIIILLLSSQLEFVFVWLSQEATFWLRPYRTLVSSRESPDHVCRYLRPNGWCLWVIKTRKTKKKLGHKHSYYSTQLAAVLPDTRYFVESTGPAAAVVHHSSAMPQLHSEAEIWKKCNNLGKPRCLPQRLKSTFLNIDSLFRNKRFALNKMFQRNASKFAIFYV